MNGTAEYETYEHFVKKDNKTWDWASEVEKERDAALKLLKRK